MLDSRLPRSRHVQHDGIDQLFDKMQRRPIINTTRYRVLGQELLSIVFVIGLLWVGSQVINQKIAVEASNINNFAPESKLFEWQNQTLKWRTGLQTQVMSNLNWLGQGVKISELPMISIQDRADDSQASTVFFTEQQAKWQAVEEENRVLREALDLKNSETTGLDLVVAPILSLTQRLIELPVGVKPEIGQVVMGKNSLLGWISAVNQQRATVSLLKDTTSFRLIGRTQTGASGLVINRRGNLYLTEVPTQTKVAVGDVIISENQLLTPAGLVVGKVQSVTTDESGTIQTALLVPSEYFGEQAVVWLQSK